MNNTSFLHDHRTLRVTQRRRGMMTITSQADITNLKSQQSSLTSKTTQVGTLLEQTTEVVVLNPSQTRLSIRIAKEQLPNLSPLALMNNVLPHQMSAVHPVFVNPRAEQRRWRFTHMQLHDER